MESHIFRLMHDFEPHIVHLPSKAYIKQMEGVKSIRNEKEKLNMFKEDGCFCSSFSSYIFKLSFFTPPEMWSSQSNKGVTGL